MIRQRTPSVATSSRRATQQPKRLATQRRAPTARIHTRAHHSSTPLTKPTTAASPRRHQSTTTASSTPAFQSQQSSAFSTSTPTRQPIRTVDGREFERSHTNLVEVINGRSKRWVYNPKTPNKKLTYQWMWSSDEQEFDAMLSRAGGGESRRWQSVRHDTINTLRSFAFSLLLPAGYPDSVHDCYRPFSTWQFVETTFNQFIHVLCSQAMLSCVGLPTDSASAAGGAVAIRWIAKDGIAHFSKLFFTRSYAYQLDYRPKTWGLISELLFVCGSAFELSTALLAKHGLANLFLPFAAAGASLQSVAHLSWEATHATFNKYLSLRNNLADVTAKADSQMVMSELLGMTLGLVYINYYNEPWQLWAAFFAALPLHLGSTMGRLGSLKFGKLSSTRLFQLYNSYVQHRLGPTKIEPNQQPDIVLSTVGEAIPQDIYTSKEKRLAYIQDKLSKNAIFIADEEKQRAQRVESEALLKKTQAPGTPSPVAGDLVANGAVDERATQELAQIRQSMMHFAQPDQFTYTDRYLGEWFDAKFWNQVYGYPEIKLCATVDEAFETEDELLGAVALFRDKHYLVNYREETNKIFVLFEEECEHDDLMQSLLVATRLAYDIRKFGPPRAAAAASAPAATADLSPEATAIAHWAPYNTIRESIQWSVRNEDHIKALLAEADWDPEEITWPDTGSRVYWELPTAPPAAITPAAATAAAVTPPAAAAVPPATPQ